MQEDHVLHNATLVLVLSLPRLVKSQEGDGVGRLPSSASGISGLQLRISTASLEPAPRPISFPLSPPTSLHNLLSNDHLRPLLPGQAPPALLPSNPEPSLVQVAGAAFPGDQIFFVARRSRFFKVPKHNSHGTRRRTRRSPCVSLLSFLPFAPKVRANESRAPKQVWPSGIPHHSPCLRGTARDPLGGDCRGS